MNKRAQEDYTDEEAERLATAALRRALTTPYKPQREMVGKQDRPSPKQKQAAAKGHPKKP
jgi:hypothetical protein